MNNTFKRVAVLAGAAMLAVSAEKLAAQQVVVSGLQLGSDGTPGTGTSTDGINFFGNDAGQGYTAPNGSGTSFLVQNATAIGGVGGAIVGADLTGTNNYQGGDGGNGLLSQGGSSVAPLVTIQSGTFTGGSGGAASGTGALVTGGNGGGGLDVNNSTVVVDAGTFTGGSNGVAVGSDAFYNQFAGAGLNANFDGVITIYGGSFTGGSGLGGTNNGPGILGLGTNDGLSGVSIYGGTFAPGGTPGANGFGIDTLGGVITLYGTDFFVNGIAATNGEVISTGTGTITGLLEDNTAVTSTTYNAEGGTIVISTAVPEPLSTAMLSLAGVFLLRFKRPGR